MNKQKGITLIALIITIIVMLILVAVSVRVLIRSDLIGSATETADLYKTAQGEEANLGEITVDGKVYASIEDYLAGNEKIANGDYKEKNGVYVNEPDLTGFSKTNTYYVTYDENGENETVGNLISSEEPTNWYDYQNKIWANIVTISKEKTAYWVWIPRYAYKITYYTDEAKTTLSEGNAVTSYGNVDVIFLSKDNVHKDYLTGKETKYNTTSLTAAGYILPETFTWNGKALAGYWVSKYEVQYAPASFNVSKTDTTISVIEIDGGLVGTYEYYLNGELKYTGTDLYTFENLKPNTEYEITVKQKYSETERILVARRKIKTVIEIIDDSVPTNAPDVSGYKNAITYYVTYDENGENETIGDRIIFDSNGNPTNAPAGWYDYKNKIWANILTASEELTVAEKADITIATTKNVAYWVWIPRYEYRIIDTKRDSDYIEGDSIFEFVSINFIGTNVTKPTIDGYIIPETFTWNGKALSGYWVSKYEVSDVVTNQ